MVDKHRHKPKHKHRKHAANKKGVSSPARRLTFESLLELSRTGGNASDILDALTVQSAPDNRDARLARELTAGVLRHRAVLDALLSRHVDRPLTELSARVLKILRIGTYQLLFLPRIPAHAAVNESVMLARAVAPRGASKLINAVLRRVSESIAGHDLPAPDDPLTAMRRLPFRGDKWTELTFDLLPSPEWDPLPYLALAYSTPEFVVRGLLGRWDADVVETVLKAGLDIPPLTVRVNPTRLPSDNLSKAEIFAGLNPDDVRRTNPPTPDRISGDSATRRASPGRLYRLPAHSIPANLPAFEFGYVAAQDPAAAAVTPWLNAQADMDVLDLCAAPGGKTLQIAGDMLDRGHILAVDSDPDRLSRVLAAARRAQLHIIDTEAADGTCIHERYPGRFDRILVDAPCSNTGVMSRRWEVRWRINDAIVSNLIDLQRRLLCSALAALKPGGRLVYSTCSILKSENEDVVAASLQDMASRLPTARFIVAAQATYLPKPGEHDGAFAAVIEREPL